MDYDHQFTVHGNPRAMGRPRAVRRGNFAGVHEAAKDTQNKESFAVIAQQQSPKELLSGPLRVDIWFYFQRPKGHFGTGRNAGILKNSAPIHYTSKPDRDNLDKLVLDALTGIFWTDDAIVCQGWLQKQYSEKPRTVIGIKRL